MPVPGLRLAVSLSQRRDNCEGRRAKAVCIALWYRPCGQEGVVRGSGFTADSLQVAACLGLPGLDVTASPLGRDGRIGALADLSDSRSDGDGDLPVGPYPQYPLPQRGPLWQRSTLSASLLAPSLPDTPVLAAEQQVLAELRRLRSEISGVDGSVVATTDGLLVAQDLPGLEPTKVAAVISTAIGLARQAVQLTGRGRLTEAIVRGSAGNLALFAVGHGAVLAVLGREDLNIGMLHYQTRAAVGRIERAAPEFRRFAAPRVAQG